MTLSISLVVDRPSGEQVVRLPRRTDAIGASLREAFAAGAGTPDDMATLLRRIDHARSAYR